MRWVDDVARTVGMRMRTLFLSEILKEKEACLDCINDAGRIILKWTLKKWNLKM
jgi:hypothetical protein